MARTKHISGKSPKQIYQRATIISTGRSVSQRVKGKNWSKEEEENLLKFSQPFWNIIESKKSDDVTTQQRNKAWEQILNSMNANSARHRTLEESKNKMKNIKKKLRAASSSHRMALLKTGGGPPPAPLSFGNEHEMALYQQIALSAEGLSPFMDSDDLIEYDAGDGGNNSDNADDESIQPESDETMCDEASDVVRTSSTIVTSITATTSTSIPPKSSTPVTSMIVTPSTSTAPASAANWSKYTPQLLRTPKSKALFVDKSKALLAEKPSSDNIAKLREIQIKQSIAMEKEKHDFEMQEARKRSKRAAKEHTLRMKLMKAELLSKYGQTCDENNDSDKENNSD